MSANNFFVLGNPRSGTSLFRSLLNAHPELVVPPECGFALWLNGSWSVADFTNKEVIQDFAHAVQGCRKFETWELDTQELISALSGRPVLEYADAIARIYEYYGEKRGKTVHLWGDKNNYYISQVPALKALFPSAKFVHIVRDVRDVACSYMELANTNISSKYQPVLSVDPEAIANEWMEHNTAALDALEGSDSYMRIRYEDLVSQVQPTISEVLGFLGVENSKSVDVRSHIDALDEPAEFMQWKKKLAAPVDTDSVGRYKRDLPPDVAVIITSICSPMLERFGYSV